MKMEKKKMTNLVKSSNAQQLRALTTRGNMHSKEELGKAKVDVIMKTKMVDFALDIYKGITGGSSVPKDMTTKRDEVLATMASLKAEVKPILDVVSDAGRVAELLPQSCAASGDVTEA